MRTNRLVKTLIKTCLALTDPLFGPFPGPRILIYHQVGVEFGREMEVSTEIFRRQLDWMNGHREIVDLEQAIERRADPTAARLFVLTFDDGFDDVYHNAFPLLKERAMPFTLYLTTDPIETGRPLDPRYPDARPLSWDQINQMVETGLVTVGAHTHTHAPLGRLSVMEIATELETADQLIEERTGIRPRHFTYPWGWWSPKADPLVRKRYDSATLGSGSSLLADTDPYQIHRLPVQASDGMWLFRARMRGGFRMEDRIRRIIRPEFKRAAT